MEYELYFQIFLTCTSCIKELKTRHISLCKTDFSIERYILELSPKTCFIIYLITAVYTEIYPFFSIQPFFLEPSYPRFSIPGLSCGICGGKECTGTIFFFPLSVLFHLCCAPNSLQRALHSFTFESYNLSK
jgi:hypothetical protein